MNDGGPGFPRCDEECCAVGLNVEVRIAGVACVHVDSEIEQKLRDEAKSWNPKHDIQPLIDAVWALDRSDDVSTLAAMTVPR